MYLLAKFGGHEYYRNGDINFYMDTSEKAKLIASILHIVRFLKYGIPIYNSEVLKRAGGKHKQLKEFCVLRKHNRFKNIK